MKCVHDRERNRCCLCSQCVRAARSLCQICIMRSVSLLRRMLPRGLPAVASSRSLFTNAFLFSSSSWLGIRPALPPSMWQACYQHTGRAVKAVSNYVPSSGVGFRPFHFVCVCACVCTHARVYVYMTHHAHLLINQYPRIKNRILEIPYEEELK